VDGRETDAVSGFWRSGKGGPDGVSTVSQLLSIVGLLESTPGSHPARGTSPTSGRAISGSGLGVPPDLSMGISALLTDSERPVRDCDRNTMPVDWDDNTASGWSNFPSGRS